MSKNMKLGIMQPYFFPYAQQLRHINQCDNWIIFDTPKFSRKSWVTRNRVANKDTVWGYISVPVVKGASQLSISKALISSADWQKKLLDSLKCYKSAAPYYMETLNFIESCIYDGSTSVADLNFNIIKKLCVYLDIDTKVQQLSHMDLCLPETAAPDEWACHISKALGASTYSNAPGGRHLFDADYYAKNNVTLEFYQSIPLEYPTPGFMFEPGLSIIDSLMWMGSSALSDWCHDEPFVPVPGGRKMVQSTD